MNIQIFGKKKCFDTQKAERYFKERRVKFQAIDLTSKGMSKGELESVIRAVGLKNLIDTASPLYQTKNLDRISTPSLIQEILLENPKLIKTPVVRNGQKATVGYTPEIWQTWE
ncbi:arsenate reductase family protein [Fusibacter bizertensis]